jgi:hypothetical protein
MMDEKGQGGNMDFLEPSAGGKGSAKEGKGSGKVGGGRAEPECQGVWLRGEEEGREEERQTEHRRYLWVPAGPEDQGGGGSKGPKGSRALAAFLKK